MNQITSLSKLAFQPERVEGKGIIITGGTTGIGRATALLLAAQGAKVLVLGRHEQELNDTLNDFREANLPGEMRGLIADTSKKESIEQIFKTADDWLGNLDIFINNAAIGYGGIMEGKYEDWQYLVETNLLAYIACSHEAAKRMKNQGGGHIVNIGSMSANVREKDSSLYVATKSGIQGFSEALRKEVNPMGIKVTLIEPGAVGTDMQPESLEEQQQQEAELKMLKAEDIAACVLYAVTQPKRCDVVVVQIRPHLQSI